MSKYKPEVLPSGVMLRKIKSEDEGFILSNIDQALIVTNLDIAAMYGLAYPEEQVNTEQAWHDVSQKFLESELKQKAESTNKCIACTIQERDEQVKQMPRHTCGIDGPNAGLDELKSEYKTTAQPTVQNISGSFSFKNGKLDFICNTIGVSFNEVKAAIIALRNECDRQINEQQKCPSHTPEGTTGPNAAYNAEVLRIAEKLARIHKGHLSSFDDDKYETKKYWTNWYLPYAYAMVAETTRQLIIYAFESVEMYKEIEPKVGPFTDYLIQRGLIPASAQEDEQNGE